MACTLLKVRTDLEVTMKAMIQQAKKRARILMAGSLMVGASFASSASAAQSTHSVVVTGCLASNSICYAAVSPVIPAGSSNCDVANADQVRWSGTTAIGQEWSRIAMAAFLAGRKVTVDTSPTLCDSTGGTSFPIITGMHIGP